MVGAMVGTPRSNIMITAYVTHWSDRNEDNLSHLLGVDTMACPELGQHPVAKLNGTLRWIFLRL